MRRSLPAIPFVLAMLFPGGALAEPIDIQVFSESYTTSVSFGNFTMNPGITDARTTTAAVSLSDRLDFPLLDLRGHAQADAALFTEFVSADAWSVLSNAGAAAESIIEFSPVVDSMGEVSIGAVTGYAIYTSSAITLWNLTANTIVWDVGWDRVSASTYGAIYYHSAFADGPVTLQTSLAAEDRYRLRVYTGVDAHGDSGHVGLALSGLTRVSEPTTLAFFLVGLAAQVIRRRRQAKPLGR